MRTIRWIFFIPVFAIVNTLTHYLYMELVDWILGTRIQFAGRKIWGLSSIHHVILDLPIFLIIGINNMALLMAPRTRIGVFVCFILYAVSIIIHYIVFGVHWTWFEFYYLLGILATIYSMIYTYNKANEIKQYNKHE
jgi:hypothetical protein